MERVLKGFFIVQDWVKVMQPYLPAAGSVKYRKKSEAETTASRVTYSMTFFSRSSVREWEKRSYYERTQQ